MSLTLQILVSGLSAGGVYGLLAAGLALVHRLTGVVHFALGDLVGLAVFVTLLVAAGTGPVTQTSVGGARFAVAVVVGFVACAAAGWATYLVAVQPYVARGSTIGWVASTLAVAFAIRAALQAGFGRPAYVFPDPFPFRRIGSEGYVSLGGASIQLRSLFVLAFALLVAALAGIALTRTRTGRALRAIVDDADGARVVGVPVERLVGLAFALAGALAALVAIAAAPSAPFGTDGGSLLGLKALVAAVVVGFASPLRAFGAGLVVGLVEAAVSDGSVLGPQYSGLVLVGLALLALAAVRRERLEAAL